MTTDNSLKFLTSEQKESFEENGYLFLPAIYSTIEMEEMRQEFHELISNMEGKPEAMKYSLMDPAPGYPIDPYNPINVQGIMDHPLANDYWFNNLIDPRIVKVFIDLLGPNIDFHNGKVRNNPPGFTNTQGWHQDWPYERHSKPELAASIIYLDHTEFNAGSTSVVPGTHKNGEWKTQDRRTVSNNRISHDDVITLSAKPGDVLFIHVMVIHSAGNNFTSKSRHKIINEYKTQDAIDQWGNQCAFAGLPLARNGRVVLSQI